MEQVVLWGILIMVLVILAAKMKIAKKGEFQEDFLSLSTSKALLGMFAVLIVLHHISQMLGNLEMKQGCFAALEGLGVCFVGMFFFFSGYGLMYSKKNRRNYLDGFLKKRLPGILIPFYVCIVIFVAFSIISQMPLQPLEIVAYLSGWWLLNNQMWYIVEIAIFYLAFFVIFKLVKKDSAGIAIFGLFMTFFVLTSIAVGHGPECECDKWLQGEWWYNSTFMMLFGMIVANQEQRLLPFVRKHYGLLLSICIIATALLMIPTNRVVAEGWYYCEYEESFTFAKVMSIKLMALGIQFSMVFFSNLAILMIMMKVKCQNSILSALGRISLDLYLIHNLFLIIFGYMRVGNITNSGVFALVVLAASVLGAVIVHFISKILSGIILKSPAKAKMVKGQITPAV